jgi:uncharacterized membrane protein YjjP (DUF1212 family)
MKYNFFTIEGFTDNKFIFILLGVMFGLLALMPTAHFYGTWLLSWESFFVSTFIYVLSAAIDPKKYFNLGTMIISFLFTYPIWAFLFNVVSVLK